MTPKIIYRRTRDYRQISPLYSDGKAWLNEPAIDVNLCDYWDYMTGIARDVISGKRSRTRPPLRRLSVFITDRCNLNCSHCQVDHRENRTIDQGWLMESMKTARRMGALFMDIMGLGEPTLVDYLPELTWAAAQLGYVTTIGTNGATPNLENPDYLSRLLEASAIKFRVSLDGAGDTNRKTENPEDTVRRKAESFIRAIVRKRSNQEIQAGIFINHVVKASNLKAIPANLNYFAELGIDDVHLIPIRFIENEYCTQKQIQMFNQEIAPRIIEISSRHKLAWARQNAYIFGRTDEEIALASRGVYYTPLKARECYLLKSQLLFDSCLRPYPCLWAKRNGGRSMEKEIGQEIRLEKVWQKCQRLCYPEINPDICRNLCTREIIYINNQIETFVQEADIK